MKSTILIVEDNAATRQPLARLLRYEGYETLCAKDGEEALEALRFMRPALILLDLLLPIMDGVEFLKVMRKNSRWEDIPVIVWSGASSNHPSVHAAHQLGARDYFVKAQFTMEQLFTSIRRHVETQSNNSRFVSRLCAVGAA